jgi:hypothetical protein
MLRESTLTLYQGAWIKPGAHFGSIALTLRTTVPFLQVIVVRLTLVTTVDGSTMVELVPVTETPSWNAIALQRIGYFLVIPVKSQVTTLFVPVPTARSVKLGNINLGVDSKLSEENIEAFTELISKKTTVDSITAVSRYLLLRINSNVPIIQIALLPLSIKVGFVLTVNFDASGDCFDRADKVAVTESYPVRAEVTIIVASSPG